MPDYSPQTWADGDPTKPLSAARMTVMETGIDRASIPTLVTALPGSPYDGQEVYFQADATNGIYWHLRYRSASASGHKWEFLGGPPLHARVATSETKTGNTYADLATAGPSITVPLAGDYDLEFGVDMSTTSAGAATIASPSIGGSTPADGDGIDARTGAAVGHLTSVSRFLRATGLAASNVIKLQYKSNGSATLTAKERWLTVRPVRVS